MKFRHTQKTYLEFLEFAKNRTIHPKNEIDEPDSRLVKSSTTKWTGTESFEEAMELATKGWESGIKQLDASNKIKVGGNTEFVPNVVGSIVNIGNYVQGVPDNMYEIQTEIEYKTERLDLYVPLSFTAGHTAKTTISRAIDIVKVINELNVDHDIRLIGIFNSTLNGKVDQFDELIIKDYGERLVLNSLAFAFHPSFFRRICFSVRESLPECDYGYGSSRNTRQVIDNLKKVRPDATGFMVPSLQDQDSVTIKDLIKI